MPTAPEERRIVAVLFAQAGGLAELPEGARAETADALFRRLRQLVEAQGGVVDKFIGDVVMAVFGAPTAHGDDTARAVRAALAFVSEAERFSAERGLDLFVRAGVNCGEVLYGSVGGDRPTVMGDTVNVAQRLQSTARPGAVVVADAARRLAGHAFRFRPLEAVAVRGREGAVEAFEAEAIAPGTILREAPGIATPLLGRAGDLGRLREAFARGAWVVLEGDAGVGKSRLTAEVRREAISRGGTWVAVGRALESVRLPLSPFAEIVRSEAGAAGFEPSDAERVVALIDRHLAESLPDPVARENAAHLVALSIGLAASGSRVQSIDPARLRSEQHAAWAAWIASRGPSLVCIEDLHWADEATMGLLEALAAARPRVGATVLATARPGARLPAGFETVRLAELAPAEALSLAETVLSGPLSPSLGAFLLEKTAGNPYYIEELARYLREERLLEGSPLALRQDAPVPAGLRNVLVARLDLLPPAHKEALKAASVLGRIFWRGLLTGLVGQDPAAALAESGERGMVFPQRESLLPDDFQYAFKHALLRDAAYSLLTRKDRARLHSRAALLLQPLFARGGRRVKALAAAHHREAGDADDAARLWLEASAESSSQSVEESYRWAEEARRARPTAEAQLAVAGAAVRLGLLQEAQACAEEILRMPDADDGSREQAMIWLARLRLRTGPHQEALDLAERVRAATSSGENRAQALLVRSDALTALGRFEEARRAADDAEAALPPDAPGAPLLRFSAANCRGTALLRLGRFGEALAQQREATGLARAAGDLARLPESLGRLGSILAAQGNYREALAYYREAVGHADAMGDRRSIAVQRSNIGSMLRYLGEYAEAARVLTQALEYYVSAGDRSGEAATLSNLGTVHGARGEYAKAIEIHRRVLAIRRDLGEEIGIAGTLNNIGTMLDSTGDYAGAMAVYVESLEIRRARGDRAGYAKCLNNIGLIHRACGRLEEALRAHEEALEINRELGSGDGIGSALVNSSAVLAKQGHWQRSLDLAREALAHFRRLGDREASAECLLEIARTLGTCGHLDASHDAILEALRTAESVGDRFQKSQALSTLGTLYQVRGEPEEARRVQDEALAIQRAIGDRAGAAMSMVRRGALLQRDARFPEAREAYETACSEFRAMGSNTGLGSALTMLGLLLHGQGHLEEALAACSESLELRRKGGDRVGIATSLFNLAFIEETMGRMEECILHTRESVAIRRELGDSRSIAQATVMEARLSIEQNDSSAAVQLAAEAAELFLAIGERGSAADALNTLGRAHRLAKNWPACTDAHARSVEGFRNAGERRGQAKALINLSGALRESGQLEAALARAEEAVALCRAMAHERGTSFAVFARGQAFAALGRAEARADFEEALRSFRAMGDAHASREAEDALAAIAG